MTATGVHPDTLPPRLTPGKIAAQIIGFLVGAALLAWCIKSAFYSGAHSAEQRAALWAQLRHADPLLVAALLGCTVGSLLINGTTFWITARPIRPISLSELIWLNVACNLLNYAPVRLGALARVLYHLRINRMTLLQIGSWFMMIGYVLALGVGSSFAATIARPRIDPIWFGMVAGLMILGALLGRVAMSHSVLARLGADLSAAMRDPVSLGGACALRMLDLALYSGRMAVALAILGLSINTHETVILALVAFTVSLAPFGRLGFREAAVALVAARLHSAGGDATFLELIQGDAAATAQLALLESAGEALVVMPLGAAALVWLRRRWPHVRSAPAANDRQGA